MNEGSSPARAGRVILVGTPIGNLGDLSPRAVSTLAGADVICCEDTRRTGRLLQSAGIIASRLLALHQHNEAAASEQAVRLASEGATVAVVTDAGMPGISDPGARIVETAVAAGVLVEVVPGPSAFVAALVASGLDAARFCFEGFLPPKGGERTARLSVLANETRTVVLYEAPHRVAKTLHDLRAVCGGERRVSVGRELTKLHEEIWRGNLDGALAWVSAAPPRG
ncbi:MAG: 16S rRNA (cytidine(1402)-2'-O)-methyltransferase [Actinomycetota bacterium]|nr:16S rRNA (cytidine(1402)-2'-O)-methyltransferase [Actinomycetota bacterium]